MKLLRDAVRQIFKIQQQRMISIRIQNIFITRNVLKKKTINR